MTRTGGSSAGPSRIPELVYGDVFFDAGWTDSHRTIVVGVKDGHIYTVALCSYDQPDRQDPTCVFKASDLPQILKVTSYIRFDGERRPRDYYAGHFGRRQSKLIGHLDADEMQVIIRGMARSPRTPPRFRVDLLGEKPTRRAPRGPTA